MSQFKRSPSALEDLIRKVVREELATNDAADLLYPAIEQRINLALSFPPIDIDGMQVQLTPIPVDIRSVPCQTQTMPATGTGDTDTQSPDASAPERLPS